MNDRPALQPMTRAKLGNVRPDLSVKAGPVVNGLQTFTVTGRRVSGTVYADTFVKRRNRYSTEDPELFVNVQFRRGAHDPGLSVNGVELTGYRDMFATPDYRHDQPAVDGFVPQDGYRWHSVDGYTSRAGWTGGDPTSSMYSVATDVAMLVADAVVGDRHAELLAAETLRDARRNVRRAMTDVRDATVKLTAARETLRSLPGAGDAGSFPAVEMTDALNGVSDEDTVKIRVLGPNYSTKHLRLSADAARMVAAIVAADGAMRDSDG